LRILPFALLLLLGAALFAEPPVPTSARAQPNLAVAEGKADRTVAPDAPRPVPAPAPQAQGDSAAVQGPRNFGFFSPLARPLFWVLQSLQRLSGNWGWALVLFALLLRLALWPLTTHSTRHSLRTAELERLRPTPAPGDPAQQQKDRLAFYARNGHNPMGGCLAALVPMPIFLAIYGMFRGVAELRHAPWALWLQDLAGKDPYYVLPVLLALAMVAQQALTPPPADPGPTRLLPWLMPVVMLFAFANLPAGLNLFYLVFNLTGLAQTWWLTRTYQPQPVLA
jgi:YidC/Oxa1 family membrane protein insertase